MIEDEKENTKQSLEGNEEEVLYAREKADIMKKKVDSAVQILMNRKKENENKATYIKMATICFSTIVTVLLGLQGLPYENIITNIAFSFGAIVTLLNALEPYFNFRAVWLDCEKAIARFQSVQDELSFYLAGMEGDEVSSDRIDKIFDKYRSVWNDFDEARMQHRKGGQ